ncbi:unnamed protein product [Ostreobium quekettii]|uniref:Sacsin/Nov domain-containing protein n=1 Tax=Ostreobium quekettii TaxID=121088 RepID=A0A8S1J0M1_9CHLO|nr:unnamed protein product [Ostreobium quekettii]
MATVAAAHHPPWRRFEQKEEFTDRIRNTLQDYNCESWGAGGVAQEFLANADDAGANRFALIYDGRTHGTANLLFPGLAEWQGPALCFFNDAKFKKGDWAAISEVGISQKREDDSKIGRFGLGALTGYCCTDVIHIVSESTFVILDPHGSYLDGGPGIELDFEEQEKAQMSKIYDTLSPLDVLGGFEVEKKHFPGTLFRLPLRTEDTAPKSRILKHVVQQENVDRLLSDFIRKAKDMILFTKHVETVEVYVRSEDGPPSLLARVKIHGAHSHNAALRIELPSRNYLNP